MCYVVENLNFKPDENSYVEPWVEPKDPEEEPELPHFEVIAPEVLKKMNAADKKKYEEEKLKHEELEMERSRPLSDEELAKKEAKQNEKNRVEKIRRDAEFFNSSTTYEYIKNLSSMGTVLV